MGIFQDPHRPNPWTEQLFCERGQRCSGLDRESCCTSQMDHRWSRGSQANSRIWTGNGQWATNICKKGEYVMPSWTKEACSKCFYKGCAVISTNDWRQFGNPFEEQSNELLVLTSKNIADQSVKETVGSLRVEQVGKEQYKTFVTERLVQYSKPLSDPIKKNKMPLMSLPCIKEASKSHMQIASLKSDCRLLARLYIVCQTRDGNLEDFFKHENQPGPPSISHQGKLRQICCSAWKI